MVRRWWVLFFVGCQSAGPPPAPAMKAEATLRALFQSYCGPKPAPAAGVEVRLRDGMTELETAVSGPDGRLDLAVSDALLAKGTLNLVYGPSVVGLEPQQLGGLLELEVPCAVTAAAERAPPCSDLPAWARMVPCARGEHVYAVVRSGGTRGDPVHGINTNLLMFYAGFTLAGVLASSRPELRADIELRRIELVDAASCVDAQVGLVRVRHPALSALPLPMCTGPLESQLPAPGCPSWAFLHVRYDPEEPGAPGALRVVAAAAVPDLAGEAYQKKRIDFLLAGMTGLSPHTQLSVYLDPAHPERPPIGRGGSGARLSDPQDERVRCDGKLWGRRSAQVELPAPSGAP